MSLSRAALLSAIAFVLALTLEMSSAVPLSSEPIQSAISFNVSNVSGAPSTTALIASFTCFLTEPSTLSSPLSLAIASASSLREVSSYPLKHGEIPHIQ